MDFFDAFFMEWGNLLLRWLHIITAIAWIGSSFFFMHLDASLKKVPDIEKGGEAWQVHGGGFYHMRKYLVSPAVMPTHLTWHKWQSYWTWISGFFLLCWIYYAQAHIYLIDPAIMPLETWQAIALGLGGLLLGWLFYDWLCLSPLGKNELVLGICGFFYVVFTAYVFSKFFSARGAMVHTGAVMATMMTMNVFLRIIPNTRKSVARLEKGENPDPAWGKQAKQRSTHNNYITLPVIFLMISNHYPLLTASSALLPWIVALVLVAGGILRYFYNIMHSEQPPPWWAWAVAACCLMLAAALSVKGLPVYKNAEFKGGAKAPVYVTEIIMGRCAMCHAENPVYEGIKIAPKSLVLDNPHAIEREKHAIKLHAVLTHAMPPNNLTGMTADERRLLAMWLKR